MSTISPPSDGLSSPTDQQQRPGFSPVVPTRPALTTSTTTGSGAGATKPKSKPRKRVNTAEKRHQHNAIERARRETLNSKFLTLARLLPSLANHRRPSKSAIVNGSISHISNQREQRLLAANLLKQLVAERDELFEEVNEWRKASGVAPRDGPANAWSDDMEEVCSVEKEEFGNFASMGGDDDGEDDVEPGPSSDSTHDLSGFAIPSVNGLITPRSSTDIDPMSHASMFQAHLPAPPAPPIHMHGINWSQDFASQFQPTAATSSTSNPTAGLSNNTPLPFSAFMSDSTDSPGTSNLGNSIMLTPPTTGDATNHVSANGSSMFTQTPSPRPSIASVDDKRHNTAQQQSKHHTHSGAPTQQWTPQQLLFLQQIQQHQAQVRHHQQNLANHYSAFPGSAVNSHSNQAANPVEGFTQSLIATMFPQQAHVTSSLPHQTPDIGMGMHMTPGVDLEQVQQWRKNALSSFLQQQGGNLGVAHLPQMRAGSPYQPPMMTPGLGMNVHGWSPDNAVEGF